MVIVVEFVKGPADNFLAFSLDATGMWVTTVTASCQK